MDMRLLKQYCLTTRSHNFKILLPACLLEQSNMIGKTLPINTLALCHTHTKAVEACGSSWDTQGYENTDPLLDKWKLLLDSLLINPLCFLLFYKKSVHKVRYEGDSVEREFRARNPFATSHDCSHIWILQFFYLPFALTRSKQALLPFCNIITPILKLLYYLYS